MPSPAGSAGTVRVVLPAFNEAEHIGSLLDGLGATLRGGSSPFHVLVVDDGSTDATAERVRERSARMPVSLLQHPTNLGLGTTLRDGLLEAVRHAAPHDVIVTMDADETQPPDTIPRMMRKIEDGHDVVIASRYQPGSRTVGVPWRRRLFSGGASLLFRLLFPTPGVRDFTCGFRAYRATALRAAIDRFGDEFLSQDGFECMVDVLLMVRQMDLVFGEVPFTLRYDRRGAGSKMNEMATIRKTLRLMGRRKLGT